MDAAIAKSGPEIGNHCRAIVPASRMGPPTEGRCRYDDASDSNFRRRKVEWFRLQQTLPLRCRIRFQFSSSQSRTVPPAEGRCNYDDASESNFLCRKVEQFRLRKVVAATMLHPIPIFVAAK